MSTEKLVLDGVTHRVELSPVEDDRWNYLLTVWSPAGNGQALLSADECHRLREYLLNGRDPAFGSQADRRCRCTGTPHAKYEDDCCVPDDDTPDRSVIDGPTVEEAWRESASLHEHSHLASLDRDDIDLAAVLKRAEAPDTDTDPRVVAGAQGFIDDEARQSEWSDHD